MERYEMNNPLKIGPHLLRGGNPDATAWIERGRPTVVKLVDCGLPGEYIDRPDWCLWVGRVYENRFDPNNPVGGGWSDDPVLAARAYVEQILRSAIHGNPPIEIWELNNEPVIKSLERMAWFSRFCAECCRILRVEYDKTAVVGNFSVGEPGDPKENDLSLWAAWGDALKAIRDYRGVMGVHCYGPLTEDYALRYRRNNRAFEKMGYGDTPVFIGECGAEGISNDGRVIMRTWREEFNSIPERYAAYLMALNKELLQDSYVIGATVYTYGHEWYNHNINDSGVGRLIGDAAQALRHPSDPIPNPETSPTPTTSRGRPRIQYARTYVLLPPGTTPELAERCVRRCFGDRYTVGFSADDAGIGDLDSRTVIAVNPEQWGGNLRAWFSKNYPGVKYVTKSSSDF
jgi:hypothetical protein